MVGLKIVAALLLSSVSANAEPRAPIATRGKKMHHGWLSSEAPCDGTVHFTIFMKQQNVDVLEVTFNAVSDPDSPRYGQFLTKQELDALVGASSTAMSAVSSWLTSNGVVEEAYKVRADAIDVTTECAIASKLFAAPFRPYEQKGTGHKKMLVQGVATVPASLRQHIDLVVGISELWHGRSRKPRANHVKEQDATDLKVTPKLLRSYYGVPDDETNPSDKNFQAVVAFNDYFSEGALSKFYTNLSASAPTLQTVGVDCLNDPQKPCDQVESDLDVQYMTAMSGMGSVKTLFHNTNVSDGWVLMKTENLLELATIPYVMSISYGWAELKQCDLAFMVCDSLGYDAKTYIARTNTNFQKLATMGSTIFVSDGDDGAQGVQPSGWDPIDMENWCPGEYTCYPRPTKPCKCAEVVLHNTTVNKKCVWPVGHMSDECSFLFLGELYQDSEIQDLLKAANPSCNMQFFIDDALNTHMYSECECSELQSIDHKDMQSEDLDVASKDIDPSHRSLFYADFPTSSPYVTSVGATVFKTTDGEHVSAEHVASIKDGAIITSGGGFSTMAPQPSWQKDAVDAYVSGSAPKPPLSSYDTTKRGYPDVTLTGHNYQVFYADNKKTDCPCSLGGVDGTSASSPAIAGMVSLINGHRLAAGQSALGFLNPLLYKAHAEDASIFNDITEGDIKCTRDYCMTYGYTAGSGWDPTAGLGSIKYAKFKAYALKAGQKREIVV